MQNSQTYLDKLILPLLSVVAVAVLLIVWKVLDLPSNEELIPIARQYFEKYGLITIFISAIVEGMLFFGLYYPGSLVIFFGVLFAAGDVSMIVRVIIVATLGMMVAYVVNYCAGKYGWYKLLMKLRLEGEMEKARQKLQKHEVQAIFGSYWHPNFAAFTSTAAGVLNMSLKRFFALSLLAAGMWNTFWGAIGAILGEKALHVMGTRFAIAILVVWVAYILWHHNREKAQ